MDTPKKLTSALAYGEPSDETVVSGGLWWRDKDRLLQRVLNEAAVDPAFERRLAEAIGAKARGNPAFRSSVAEASKEGRPGRKAVPYSELASMLYQYDALRFFHPRATSDLALEKVADIYSLSPKAVSARLTKARKSVLPRDRFNVDPGDDST